MIKLKKLFCLLIYFLIVGNVLISGCTDKENTATEVVSSQSGITSSECDYDNPPETEFFPNRLTQSIVAEQYKDIKERGYPTLEGINIEFGSPNMELIGSYLLDERTHKDDPNWKAYIVIRNNGNDGIWLGNMDGLYKLPLSSHRHLFLGSNEISMRILSGENVVGDSSYGGYPSYDSHITLDNLLDGDVTFRIKACDTTTPRVSSEFGQFCLEHEIARPEQALDVESIEYKVDDNGWKYIVIKVNNPGLIELKGYVKIYVDGAGSDYHNSKDSGKVFNLKPGGSETFEMCLRDNVPTSLNRVIISTVQK